MVSPPENPAPIPGAGVRETPTLTICINASWAGHIDGCLQILLDPDHWAGTAAEQEAAVQEVEKLLVALAIGGGCP